MLFDCVIFEFALVKVKTFLSSLGSFSSFLFFSRQLYLFIYSFNLYLYTVKKIHQVQKNSITMTNVLST